MRATLTEDVREEAAGVVLVVDHEDLEPVETKRFVAWTRRRLRRRARRRIGLLRRWRP